MKKIILVSLVAALLSVGLTACSDRDSALRALSAQGFTNINAGGWAMFGCDEKDQFHTSFTATGPTGVPVHGVVCKGFLKGSTVRTF